MNDDQERGILSEGEVLNNTYVIAELVASGGTGEVYRATNRVSGREIAIKILKREFAQDEKFIELMKREASVLHEVIDPAVVRYYDLLESDLHGGFLFLVMEFIDGHSLADEMKRRGPLDAEVLLKVARRVLQGLKAAHEKKAFHRDLSPDNVLLRGGDPAQATLIDFGIAKDVNEGAKTVVGGGFAGKYQYASPEQMEGRADARSDLYSLGMTLLGAYRGQPPLAGSSMMEIIKAKAEKPDLSDMSGLLHDLVSRLVEPDPDKRFQSAEEALRFLEGRGTAAPAAPDAEPTDRTVVRPRAGAPAAGAARAGGEAAGTPPAAAGKAAARKGGGGRLALAAMLVLLLAAGGAWFAGLFDRLLAPAPAIVAESGGDGAGGGNGGGTPSGDQPDAETPQPTPEVADAPEAGPGTGQAPAAGDETAADAQSAPGPATEPATEPELPLADPYRLTIERSSPADPVRLTGNIPSAAALPALTRTLEEGLDTFAVLANVTPARGQPFEGWAEKIVEVAKAFAALDSFSISAEGTDLTLSARAETDAEKNALLAAVWQVIEGSGLRVIDRIEVAPPAVSLADLAALLRPRETCGPLRLSGGTGGVIGPSDTIEVSGHVASPADRTRLVALLRQAAPGRAIEARMETLNPGVCAVLSLLPPAPSPGIAIEYAYGTREGTVENDTFHLGENPVIDILVPAERDGFIHVAYVDLAEQVFHLLPHQARPVHRLQLIGEVEGDTRRIRVAYPVSEASLEKLGFKVVEPTGTNLILAVVSDQPLFSALRPRAESNAAFLEALGGRLAQIPQEGGLVSWRFLRTEP